MTQTTMNIKISISRNYNTVSAEFVEETIEYTDDIDLQLKINAKYALLKTAVDAQLDNIAPKQVQR